MREVKFRGRAKEPIPNKWFYGGYVRKGKKRTKHYIVNWDEKNMKLVQVDPKSIGQYTGLKDIEQFGTPKELYTGDIVKMHQFLFDGDEWESEITGVLSYDEEVAAVCLTKINSHDIREYMGYGNPQEFQNEKIPICMFYGLNESSWTYVGNIYEHPHLLGD